MAITNQQIQAGIGNEGSGAPTVHEIFTKINNAKDKPQKIAILKQYDNQAMRQMLKAAFDPTFTLTIFGNDYPTQDGTCVRDYIHVDDIADAHLKALFSLEKNTSSLCAAYNLGNGNGYSVNEIIKSVERVSGKKVKVKYGSRREGDPPILIADPTKANRELGWKAKNLSISTIIQDAWNWYLKINSKF